MEILKPTHIEQISDKAISVKWSDGHESIFFADHLRKNCPCADCESKRAKLAEKAFSSTTDVNISAWEMMGRYAVGFRFSDGHGTGIYIYENLRALCQCDICTDKVIRIQGPLA